MNENPIGSAGESRFRRQSAFESLVISVVMLIVVAAAVGGLWANSAGAIRDGFRHSLSDLARTAAHQIDPRLHQMLRRPEQLNSPDYLAAVAPLQRMQRAVPEIHYLYTVVRDGKDIRFILDAADPAAVNNRGKPEQSVIWELYPERTEAMEAALGSAHVPGHESADQEPTSDAWGTFISTYAPIYDSAGTQIGALGMDVDATTYLGRLAGARNRAIYALVPAGLLTAAFSIFFYRVRRRGLVNAQAALDSVQAGRVYTDRLAEGQRRLAAVIEGTNVGTWDWRMDRAEIVVNDRLAAIFGYTLEDRLVVSARGWRALIHAEDVSVVKHAMRQLRETPDGILSCEFRLPHRDGQWIWVLLRGRVMSMAGTSASSVAGIVMDISDRKRMEAELLGSAQMDKLTGLANRAVFTEHLESSRRRLRKAEQRWLAVLFLDFDRFKLINDTLGHEAGDELLKKIADRLRQTLRRDDAVTERNHLISRFGGDEFLVLLDDLPHSHDAVVVAERLLKVLSLPYEIGGVEVNSTASIGIVTDNQGRVSAAEVIRNADVAMYEAKRAGRGCFIKFDDAMHERVARQAAIESELRRAVGTPDLYLEYQPVVDLTTGCAIYVEALVRWKHHTMGQVSPAEFIAIAEESELIVTIGRWVRQEACRAMTLWRTQDPINAPVFVSVNISWAELSMGPRLYDEVKDLLESSGLPSAALQLEITERDVMRDSAGAGELLKMLHEAGIKIAMDDFGTGNSSLSMLRTFPFDTIKIDRSFLTDLSTSREVMAVIHATVTLIDNLGMICVAEGVENPIEIALLQSIGCRLAQGYLFSASVPRDQVISTMQNIKPNVEI